MIRKDRAVITTLFVAFSFLLVFGFARAGPIEKIGVFTDSHYYLDHDSKPFGDRRPIAEALVGIFEASGVSLIVGLGDHYEHWALVGTAEERAAYNASQRDAYEAVWDLTGIRKYWVVGNHDNYGLSAEDYVGLSSYTPAENFSYDIPGTDIRTLYWTNVRQWSAAPETLSWLDAELANVRPGGPDAGKRILAFAHLPISSIVTPSAVSGSNVTLSSSTPVFDPYCFPIDPDPSFVKTVQLKYAEMWYGTRYLDRNSRYEIQVEIIDTLPSIDPADDWTESGDRPGSVSANQKAQRDLFSAAAASGAKILGVFTGHKHSPGYMTTVDDVTYFNILSSTLVARGGVLTVTNTQLALEGFNGQQSYYLDLDPDPDGDGLLYGDDNCIFEPNPDQRDSSQDGFGNACDADINEPVNDCITNFPDLSAMRAAFFTTPNTANWNPHADLNGDSIVNFLDLEVMRRLFLLPPGPSSVPNICQPDFIVRLVNPPTNQYF